MVLKFGVVHLLLAVVLSVMVVKTYSVWQKEFDLPVVATQAPPEDKLTGSAGAHKVSAPPNSVFDGIVRRSLFSETREEVIPVVDEAVEPVVMVENKIKGTPITLYGVVISKAVTKALISNPEKKPDAPPLLWVQPGEKIGGVKVVSIEATAVVFSEGEEKYRVLLYDKTKSRASVTPSTSNKPNVVTTTPSENEQKTPAVPAVNEERSSKEEYEVISTPFGELKRRKN